jgi:hypothetical protein
MRSEAVRWYILTFVGLAIIIGAHVITSIDKPQHYNFEIVIRQNGEEIKSFQCWTYKEEGNLLYSYLEGFIEIKPPIQLGNGIDYEAFYARNRPMLGGGSK